MEVTMQFSFHKRSKKEEADSYVHAGLAKEGRGQNAEAIAEYERALAIRSNLEDFAGVSECLNRLLEANGKVGNVSEAAGLLMWAYACQRASEISRLDHELERAKAIGDRKSEREIRDQQYDLCVDACRKLGECRFDPRLLAPRRFLAMKALAVADRRYFMAKLSTVLNERLALARSTEDRVLEGETVLALARMWRDSDVRRAVQFYEEHLPFARETGNWREEEADLNNLGTGHAMLGNREKAVAFYNRALAVARAHGDAPGIEQVTANIELASSSRT
jgi:tetratricopeptide (TPR) repeat protein